MSIFNEMHDVNVEKDKGKRPKDIHSERPDESF